MNRRGFLMSLSGAACLPACKPRDKSFPDGELLGVSSTLGHRIRDGNLPAPDRMRRASVVIVGAGVAGLSAAWAMMRAGMHDFTVLELETEPGGNARGGHNPYTAFPWGAHYLPIPTRESIATRLMLAEFGLLHGDPMDPKPHYEERHLCHAPQERLYINGLWQEGLVPQIGLTRTESDQLQRFEALTQQYKTRRDAQGRKPFALPMALSSHDPDLLALDRISMRDFLLSQGLDAAPLHWYVDYCCRDDFGCTAAQTSAWAGMHYFCCRDGEAANAAPDSVLTWPEGNAWLIRQLASKVGDRLRTGTAVFRINEKKHAVELDVYHTAANRSERIVCDHVIWSAPLFALPRIWRECPNDLASAIGHVHHAPWLTANLALSMPPADAPSGASLAWDNVLYGTTSLGYVVATHQDMRSQSGPTVLTYYRPLAEDTPAAGRQRLLHTPWRVWAEDILHELGKPHPELAQRVQRIDVWRNGHAMVRPEVGFIWGDARARLTRTHPRLHMAHADLSGFSVFEEAQYRGIVAAERVLRASGIRHASLLT